MHHDANGDHAALWAEDLRLKAQISAVVNDSRYDTSEMEQDDDEDENAAVPEPHAHPHYEELFDDSTGDPNLPLRIDGIFLREEIFGVLTEIIDKEIKARDEDDDFVEELEDLEASINRQRQACVFAELLALVKVLAKTSRLEYSLRMLAVW